MFRWKLRKFKMSYLPYVLSDLHNSFPVLFKIFYSFYWLYLNLDRISPSIKKITPKLQNITLRQLCPIAAWGYHWNHKVHEMTTTISLRGFDHEYSSHAKLKSRAKKSRLFQKFRENKKTFFFFFRSPYFACQLVNRLAGLSGLGSHGAQVQMRYKHPIGDRYDQTTDCWAWWVTWPW